MLSKRGSSDCPNIFFAKLRDVNQLSIGRSNIPFGEGTGFDCLPQAPVHEKILLSERKKTPQYPLGLSDCGVSVRFDLFVWAQKCRFR